MLPKKKKLSSSEVRRVFNSSDKNHYHSSFFKVVFIKEAENKLFAVSVPNKVVRKAVDRNRVRRRVFSFLEAYYENIKPGMYVIIVNIDITETDTDLMVEDLKKLLLKHK